MSSGGNYVFYCERCTHRFAVPLPHPPSPDPCHHCGHPTLVTSVDDDEYNKRYAYVTLSPEDQPLSHDTLSFLDTFPEPQQISDCVICQGSLDAEADQGLKVAGCGHIFHRVCLGKHLDYADENCPLCRRPVRPGESNENPPGDAESNTESPMGEDDEDNNEGSEQEDDEYDGPNEETASSKEDD